LDGPASRVDIAVKHFWGLMTVRGTFGQVLGEATVDAAGAVSATITVDVASLDTKQKKRDEHLRSADFFNVTADPTASFVTTEVIPNADGGLDVRGLLTIAGHTHPTDTTVALSGGDAESVIADAHITIDRNRFGMTWSPMRMASADVLVSARLCFRKR
jgi:polyisoprenoid-binding protein YceI